MTEETTKPFILQRKQLGRIRMLNAAKKYGFITAEDYRDDVFFHFASWESKGPRDAGPRLDQFVEFELDELYRRETGKLRVVSVRATQRPDGIKLDDKADPHLRAKHHPKARRSKPAWRSNKGPAE